MFAKDLANAREQVNKKLQFIWGHVYALKPHQTTKSAINNINANGIHQSNPDRGGNNTLIIFRLQNLIRTLFNYVEVHVIDYQVIMSYCELIGKSLSGE